MSPSTGHLSGGDGAMEVRDISKLSHRVPILLAVGLVALLGAGFIWFQTDDPDGHVEERRLALAYLTGFAAFFTVSIGALFFVIIQHLTRAGWSVTVRRLAECMAVNLWTMLLLAVPILVGVKTIYVWADHPENDPAGILQEKMGWLNQPFFTGRILFYFACWLGMATWLWRWSLRQDRTGETRITDKMQNVAGLLVVIFALSTMFGYIDLLMTLDPHWYSTMFGVYVFAGSFLNFCAVSILLLRNFQKNGIVTRSVQLNHYHDLGKFMFAFVFFWSYVMFSQWMLIWYANMPEETAWFAKRGATTDDVWSGGTWGYVALMLLFFHFLFPFAGMLSRWSKRYVGVLTFWALWMFLMHFVDMFWIVMPEVEPDLNHTAAAPHFQRSLLLAALCWLGIGCIWLAGVHWFARKGSLIPVNDPRLHEALGHEVY